jgi:hypothetical protein
MDVFGIPGREDIYLPFEIKVTFVKCFGKTPPPGIKRKKPP